VERIKPPATGQIDRFDAGYPGLALRVSYGGSRSWVYFYRWRGKQRRLTLGSWPSLGLGEARDVWRDARRKLSRGEEPTTAPAAVADRFEDVLADWLKRDQGGNRSHDEVKRILHREVLPAWGKLRLAEIGKRQIRDLIDAIVDRGAVTLARRCHAHLHRLFRWSVGRDFIPSNPMTDMLKPGAEVKRDRVLNDDELRRAWIAAQQIGWPMGPAIRLLVLTCARREEIGALKWREIDRERDEIRLQGDRTKNGEPHTIPLSGAAKSLIDALPRMADSEFVFTTTGNTPVSGWSRAKANLDQLLLARARLEASDRGEDGAKINLPAWRIHDLRRTTATGMERLGIKQQVVEALLGHIAGSKAGVVGIYQRHTYEEEKREALERWAKHIASLARRAK
jgi:integrase